MLPQGVAEHLHGIGPHPVQLHDVGLGDLGEVLKAGVAGPCSARRAGAASFGRLVSSVPIVCLLVSTQRGTEARRA